MKGFFKLIFGIIIFLVITVGLPLGILYVSIQDSVDEAPTDLYAADVTLSGEMTNLLNRAFDLDGKDYLSLTFTEDEINRMIFASVRDSLNPDYLPSDTCTTDECKYIQVMAVEVPVLGSIQASVNNIYVSLEDDLFALYITMDLAGIKTRAKLIASFSENDDYFVLTFVNLGLGRMNLLGGLGNTIMTTVLDQMDLNDEAINDMLEEKGFPFELDLANSSMLISKDKISDLIEQFINPTEMEASNEKDMLSELVLSLASKDNDLVDIGVFDGTFGVRFDLTKFEVDPSISSLNTAVMTFDETIFIQNKVQGFIFSNLVPTADSKMIFTNLEFNQMLYSQSSGYSAFVVEIPIPETESTVTFEVIGILLDFNADNVEIRININLNGLITSLKLTGTLINNNSAVVGIQINEQITLGQDIDEVVGDYITANSGLILGMLSENIGDLGFMSFSEIDHAFVLNAASFTQLMAIDGTNVTPLTVTKLNIVDNALEVYVSIDPSDPLASIINDATTALNNVLSSNDFTIDDFVTDDEEQQAVIEALISSLDTIADGLTNGTLTEEDTTELIEIIGNMSPENQAIFLDQLEDDAASADLLALYDSLFGK